MFRSYEDSILLPTVVVVDTTCLTVGAGFACSDRPVMARECSSKIKAVAR